MASEQERAAAMERVSAWVASIQEAKADKAKADGAADQESLARAADLELLYADEKWTKEVEPPPRKKTGRPIRRNSREQFGKWVRLQFDGWGSKSYLSNLSAAHSFVRQHDLANKTTERAIRPLFTLRDQGYGEHMLTVWKDAIRQAGNRPPTAAEVRKAVNAFLEAHKPPVKNTAVNARAEAERRAARRARIVSSFAELLDENDNELAEQALDEMILKFNDKQRQMQDLLGAVTKANAAVTTRASQ